MQGFKKLCQQFEKLTMNFLNYVCRRTENSYQFSHVVKIDIDRNVKLEPPDRLSYFLIGEIVK